MNILWASLLTFYLQSTLSPRQLPIKYEFVFQTRGLFFGLDLSLASVTPPPDVLPQGRRVLLCFTCVHCESDAKLEEKREGKQKERCLFQFCTSWEDTCVSTVLSGWVVGSGQTDAVDFTWCVDTLAAAAWTSQKPPRAAAYTQERASCTAHVSALKICGRYYSYMTNVSVLLKVSWLDERTDRQRGDNLASADERRCNFSLPSPWGMRASEVVQIRWSRFLWFSSALDLKFFFLSQDMDWSSVTSHVLFFFSPHISASLWCETNL